MRLKREDDWAIVNVAVTLGSDRARRDERKKELAAACAALGFLCVLADENGLSDVTAAARDADAAAWNRKVDALARIIAHFRPKAVFMPHAGDRHAAHVGAHLLGMDALAKMPKDFSCTVALSEYWRLLDSPNVLVGLGENDLAALMSALACHKGEVARNAYDRRFPSFLIDAVRRFETIGTPGCAAPDLDFAQLLCLGLWVKGRFVPSALNRIVRTGESVSALFE